MNPEHNKTPIIIPALLALVVLLAPELAFAAAAGCPDEGLTYRAVSCIRNVFYEAVNQMMPYFQGLARQITNACITLAFGILGFRTILGQTQDVTGFGRDFVWLLVKVAAVVYLVNNFQGYYMNVVNGVDELLYAVIAPLNTSTLGSSCPLPASTTQAALIWARVDCILGAVLGFGMISGGVFLGIGEALRAGFGSTVSGNEILSAVGPIISAAGIAMFFGLLLSFFRAVNVFLTTYLGLAFCFLLAPVMFPLILFKFTNQMFASWLQAIIGFILQPVLVMATISMMIIGLDKAFFTDVGSLAYAISGGHNVCSISAASSSSCVPAPASLPTSGASCRYDNFQYLMNQARACGIIANCEATVGGVNTEVQNFAGCLLRNNQAGNQTGVNSNVTMAMTPQEMLNTGLCNPELLRVVNPFQSTMSGFINFSTQTSCFVNVDAIELLGAFLATAVLCLIFYTLTQELPQIVGSMTSNLPLIGARRMDSLSQNPVPFEGAIKGGAAAMGQDIANPQGQGFGAQTVESFQRGFIGGLFK